MARAGSNVGAVIAHGTGHVVAAEDEAFDDVDAVHAAPWWDVLRREGRGAYIRVEAAQLFAWMGPGWPPEAA
ncbi:MAG TPA: hypothetical protein VGI98_04370 [Candidatus Limnocylindrales bacterium]|jgi:hypothetical protein